MTISNNLRMPILSAEFDPSRAFQGPALLKYQAVAFGQMTSSGTATANELVLVTSADQAAVLFGAGSQLSRMLSAWFDNNKTTTIYAVPIDDNGAGVAATGTITFTGTATAAGTVSVLINGTLVQAAVASGDAATDVGDALVTAITADTSLPVSAANVAGVVTLTAKNKGENGNDIDVQQNFNVGEETPAGITSVIVAMSSGSANPASSSLNTAIGNLGEEWFNVWLWGWSDTTSRGVLETELADRFGALRMIDGVAFLGLRGNLATLLAYGAAGNSPHVEAVHGEAVPEAPEQVAAAQAGQIASEAEADPAKPFQTLPLNGITPPKVADRFTYTENNSLLYSGVSTWNVDNSGTVRIGRAITMYQTNSAGAADIAYLDVNTMFTLMYIRYSFRNQIATKYPRAKLADDGKRIQATQQVMTPKVMKAEAISAFKAWEFLGLVENIDQFKTDLVVERNISDPNRIDVLLPPDLVNQFRVAGITIQFLLQSPSI